MTVRKLENGATGARRITIDHDDITATLYTQHRLMAAKLAGERYVSTTPNRANVRIDGELHGIYMLFPVGDKLALAGAYDDGDGDAGVIFYLESPYDGWQVGKHYFEFNDNEIEAIKEHQIPAMLAELMKV